MPIADVRADLGLEGLGADEVELAYRLSRGRFGAQAELGELVGGRVLADVSQTPATGNDWGLALRDAYLQGDAVTGRVRHRVRAGIQLTSFGVEGYGTPDLIFLPHPTAFQPMAHRVGAVERRVTGLGYRAEAFDLVTVDAQLINGTGHQDVEDNLAKDWVARLQVHPLEQVTAVGSVQHGADGANQEEVFTAWQAGVVGDVVGIRALVELLGRNAETVSDQATGFGWAAAAAYDVELGADWIDALGFSASREQWDPDTGSDFPDLTWVSAVAATGYWATRDEATAWTGVVYENTIPENLDLPIEHAVSLQWGWSI